MSIQNTPGPWEYAVSGTAYSITADSDPVYIAIVEIPDRPSKIATAEANARLISAAPDLLEAAIELRSAFLDGCGDATKGPKRARLVKAGAALELAIVKAKGGAA